MTKPMKEKLDWDRGVLESVRDKVSFAKFMKEKGRPWCGPDEPASIVITFAKFVGFGVDWRGYWATLYLPFFVIRFYFPLNWKVEFVNDWEL